MSQVTRILNQIDAGDQQAAEKLLPLVYEELRKLDASKDARRTIRSYLAADKEEGREENRREAIELLKKAESVIPYAERWLLGNQFGKAVVAPEFDLAAWEREHGSVTADTEVTL